MHESTAFDPRPWARFPDGDGGSRSTNNAEGNLYWYPRRVLMTHPHGGHTARDTCMACEQACGSRETTGG